MAKPNIRLEHAAKLRIAGVLMALVTAIAATYFVPALTPLQPWRTEEDYVPFWNVVAREFLGGEQRLRADQQELERLAGLASLPGNAGPSATARVAPRRDAGTASGHESTRPKPEYPAFVPMADDVQPKVLIDNAERMKHFFEKLTLVELQTEGAVARAAHWGDSVIGDDGITHAIRQRMQGRFGDAGHGFHALARYNLAYVHQGVHFSGRGQWRKCEIIFKCEPDARYGFGGVSTSSSGGGTGSWWTKETGLGSAIGRFELWYAGMPAGGKFQIKVDGKVDRIVDTERDALTDEWEVIDLPDGAHKVEVRAIGDGVARGYGAVLERRVPGVVWDSLALIGSFTQRLDYQEQEHISRQVARRDTDLLVFMLGGNDVQREKMDLYRTTEPYEQEYQRVVRKYRAGKPRASCLLLSLVDHAEKDSQNVIRSRRIVPRLVEGQRKVARRMGCAFYNTYAAMGGTGSAGRWFRAKPRLMGADLGHLTSHGHRVIARLFYQALMTAYQEFREARTGDPLPELNSLKNGAEDTVRQVLQTAEDAGAAASRGPTKDATADPLNE